MRVSPAVAASLALLCTGAVAAGCQESSEFTPVAPSALAERVTRAIDERGSVQTYTVLAGRMGDQGGFVIYQGENPSFVYAADWSSAGNHVTLSVHRRGGSGAIDGAQPSPDTCTVPFLHGGGGTPIDAPLTQPLCPAVLANASTDKPKTLEIQNLPPGDYAVVITNYGPGNETVRLALWEN